MKKALAAVVAASALATGVMIASRPAIPGSSCQMRIDGNLVVLPDATAEDCFAAVDARAKSERAKRKP